MGYCGYYCLVEDVSVEVEMFPTLGTVDLESDRALFILLLLLSSVFPMSPPRTPYIPCTCKLSPFDYRDCVKKLH